MKLRRTEVEELLGLEPGLLLQWHRRGLNIPYYQIGGTSARVYDRDEILAWWESKRRIGKQPASTAQPFSQLTSPEDVQKARFDAQVAATEKHGNVRHDRPSFEERMAAAVAKKNGKT